MKQITFLYSAAICFLILSCSMTSPVYGQNEGLFEKAKLEVKIMDESLGYFDLNPSVYGFNPAVSVGLEFPLKEKANSDWHLFTNVLYYNNKSWQSGISLNAALGYRCQIKRFSIAPRLGVGYTHTFSSEVTYAFEDGEFKQKTDFGSPTFTPSLELNLAYIIGNRERGNEIVLTLMQSVEVPFTTYTGVHQFVGLGYRFSLNK